MAFDLNKLSKREKNLIGFLFVAISTIPFFQFTIPAWNNYQSSKSKITENKTKIVTMESQIKRLENLKLENEKIQKKINSQKQFLAKSYEIDFLVQDLKKICDQSSISLESFTPISPEPLNIILEKQMEAELRGDIRNISKLRQASEKLKDQDLPIDLYRFPIEVKVTGNFTDILELLKSLEQYGRTISVDNISIGKITAKVSSGDRLSKSKKNKPQKSDGGLFGTFDLIAYSLPQEEETITLKELRKSTKSTFTHKKSSI